MQSFLQDFRFALRQLRKSPGFAITVALTLALSVGVATAVFSVIDAVILRPLPFQNPQRIVSMESRSKSGYTQPDSGPSYMDERKETTSLENYAGYFRWRDMTLESPSGPVVVTAVRTTDNFFNVFGVPPLLGRGFLPGEQDEGKNNIVVLSYGAWQKYFGGARDVLGKSPRIDGVPSTIVGVMPAGFRFPLNLRDGIYTPIHLNAVSWMNQRGSHWLRTVARLKDGVSLEQARADMSHVYSSLGQAYPTTDAGRTVRVSLLTENVDSTSKGPLWTLLGAVFAVLAIGCVNVAGLLLARGVKREREMAMRVAIGAGRARLLGQVLTEGLMLAFLGGAGGVALAWLLLRVMRSFLIGALARGADVSINWIVLAAALAIAITASMAASLYPALRLSGIEPNRALKSGGNTGAQRGQYRLRSAFVITQVALTLVLLVVAGLLLRVVSRYRHADLGFDPAHILAVDLHLSPERYANSDVLANLYRPLEVRAAALPGVSAAGFIDMLPIESWGSNSEVHINGQPPYPPNQEMLAENRIVSLGYFSVMGIPLHAGRSLSPSLDISSNKSPTVVVNDAFVHKFLPSGYGPVTPRLDDNDKLEQKTQAIGVVGNVRQNIYDSPLAEMDYLMDEIPPHDRPAAMSTMVLVVRAKGDPKLVIPALRKALHDIDPTIPLGDPRTMTDVVAETLIFERMESWLFGIFAGLALVLAMVGLYGLVSQEVEQGRRDIGVRMALGATRKRVLAMVLNRVTWLLAAGTVAGLVLTLIARKLIGVVIYFDAQKEVGGFLILALVLIVAGLIAALIPAFRAASTEPMQALRTE